MSKCPDKMMSLIPPITVSVRISVLWAVSTVRRSDNSPIFQSDETEVVHLDHLQPLTDGVKDELQPVLAELDAEIVGQGVLVAVGDLHPFNLPHVTLD